MASRARPKFKRVVLKISGEGLCKAGGFGIDADQTRRIAREVKLVRDSGVEVAVVLGGGNFLRGATAAKKSGITEATAHHMGMLATVINALALQEALEGAGVEARVMSAVAVASICEAYDRRHCMEHLRAGRVVVLAGGTGRPFVTTDTAAALAALETGADAVLKATKVDGVYDSDPMKNPKARRYDRLSYDQVLADRLGVMDLGAIELCRNGGVPVIVFDLYKPGNMRSVVRGAKVGTVVA